MTVVGPCVYAKTSKSQIGIVSFDQTPVYKSPDFDSVPVDYLPKDKKIKISTKVYKGPTNFGSFYKVVYYKGKKKIVGYIADNEVVPKYKRGGKDKVANPVFEKMEDFKEMKGKDSVLYSRFIGATGGVVDYVESIQGVSKSALTNLIGFKLTGPGTIFDGPPIDIEFSMTLQAPDYYKLYTDKVSGNIFFGHIYLLLPIFENKNGLAYYGFGPMMAYSRIQITVGNGAVVANPIDSQEVRIGGLFAVGYAHRFGNWGLRLEGKQYIEKEQYVSLTFSVQREY